MCGGSHLEASWLGFSCREMLPAPWTILEKLWLLASVCVEVGERYIHLSLYDQARSRPQIKAKDSRPSLMTLQHGRQKLGPLLGALVPMA